jgi:hypothetical protein
LLLSGLLFWAAGLLAELQGINRRLLQDVQYMLRRQRAEQEQLRRATRDGEKSEAVRRIGKKN